MGDPWLPSRDNPWISTPVYDQLRNATVNSLMNEELNGWDVEILNDLLLERDRHLVLKVPITMSKGVDSLYWAGEVDGRYSVRSAYRLLAGEREGIPRGNWTCMWTLCIPPKGIWDV
nr:uncharacterized mitochondrial protein AtMg00310-like [Ipomoea batatas]